MQTDFSKNDKTSYANSEDFVVECSHFNWELNFDKELVQGSVIHTVRTINPASTNLILDCNNLNITKTLVNGHEVVFQCLQASLSDKLIIKINKTLEKFLLEIFYSTNKDCKALQWMTSAMTYGGKYPYMYSQCQAIHARSLFPCQDSPMVKGSYTAEVKAPAELEVLMSAIKEECRSIENDVKVHKFRQKIPIPSYLVAIACGNIEGRRVGPRSTVWSEPGMVNEAQWEFEDIENILVQAEALCGPYEWGVYDILVLPPTFPYGGMENPCLTFVTPCLLSGDRSQVYVVAHEIAHSWTGNLVTNSSWDHFWVNEGHTNYLERLILEQTSKSEEYRHLHIFVGLAELEESLCMIAKCNGDNHQFMKLIPELIGIDPDDCFSRVPYEKGSFLLFYLENIVGKEKILRWLKTYIATYRLTVLSSDEWKRFFLDYMVSKEGVDLSLFEQVEWDKWFYGTGKIPVDPYRFLNHSLVTQINELVHLWMEHKETSINERELLERYTKLLPDQKYYFFQTLNDVEKVILSPTSLRFMGQLYGLTSTKHSELLYGWSLLCLRSNYKDPLDQIFTFLNSQGRLKYNKTIYKCLFDWEYTKDRAIKNFEDRKNMMHPITRDEVRKILYPDSMN